MIEQGMPEWHEMRLGKVTASRISDVISRTKTGWGASRANYAAELIAERLTGNPTAGFTSAAMQHGLDTEPEARAAYELLTGSTVVEMLFIDHPTIPMTGASPDGLVADDGLLEIKCPNTATHIATLRGKKPEKKYFAQMQWQMACSHRKWCDFVSYDPRLPAEMRLHIERVDSDPTWILETEKLVIEFLAEIDETVRDLRERYGEKDAA